MRDLLHCLREVGNERLSGFFRRDFACVRRREELISEVDCFGTNKVIGCRISFFLQRGGGDDDDDDDDDDGDDGADGDDDGILRHEVDGNAGGAGGLVSASVSASVLVLVLVSVAVLVSVLTLQLLVGSVSVSVSVLETVVLMAGWFVWEKVDW